MQGITYAHEHITIDLSGIKKDLDCCLNDIDATVDEFRQLQKLGVSTIIDVTNRGMGRNIMYVQAVMEKTGMQVQLSTGYYKEPFFPAEVFELSSSQLAKIMIDEIVTGMEETSVKAKIIGEIGTSNVFSELERKVFHAAALAHLETGAPIVTHTTLGQLGLEQVTVLKTAGVCPERVVIGHVDLSGDIDYVLRLIDSGVYVAFDTVGKINYQPDTVRAEMIKELCRRGLSDRIMLSMDITRKSHLKSGGGLGYAYLLTDFIPLLKRHGITERAIENMLVNNPRLFFHIGM